MSAQKKIPTHSRGSCVFDHCGKLLTRHNLKKHTHDHHLGMPVRERIVGLMSFDKFVQKIIQVLIMVILKVTPSLNIQRTYLKSQMQRMKILKIQWRVK